MIIDFVEEEIKPVLNPEDDDIKQSRTDSTPPAQIIITSDRSQQTSALDMPLNFDDDDNDDTTIVSVRNTRSNANHHPVPHHRSRSEQRHSGNSSLKPSSSEEQTSTIPAEEDEREERSPPNQLKSILSVPVVHNNNRTKLIPTIKQSKKIPGFTTTSVVSKKDKTSSLKWSSSINTRKYF